MGLDKETQDRIVSIQIPLVDGENAYFSGYILANGYLITCLHGFVGADKKLIYDTDQKIKIISQGVEESLELSSEDPDALLENDKIILYKSEKYDVVILHHKNLKGSFHQPHLDELEEKGEFDAGGYPYFNHKNSEDSNGFTPFHGTHSAIAHKSKLLDLSSITIQVPKMEHWREVSGSPVFVDNKLTGIIQKYDKYDDQHETYELKNLKATYLKRLWDDEDENESFRSFVNDNILSTQSSMFRRKVDELLAEDSLLKSSLAEYLKVEQEQVVNKLLSKDKLTILDVCLSLKQEQVSDAIDQLFLYAMASNYEGVECFAELPTPDKPYSEVPAVFEEAMEFVMASEDQREPGFYLKNNRVYPQKYSINSPPEEGIKQEMAKNIIHDIEAEKGADSALIERLFLRRRKSPGRDYDDKTKKNSVKLMFKRSEGTYYWSVDVTENNRQALKEVYEALPQIKILKRDDDHSYEIQDEEEALFENLPQFIK